MPPSYTIAGKPIYIVEKHSTVIHAWGEIRAALKITPLLITLDYHADTRPAFTVAICKDGLDSFDGITVDSRSREYCGKAGLVGGKVSADASERLENDEHIDAATTGGVIDHAYVISFQEGNPTLKKRSASCSEILTFLETHSADEYDDCPFTPYDLPSNRIFEVQPTCIPGCFKEDHSGCAKRHADAAIESDFLEMKLNEIGEMAKTLGISNILAEPFILDIDLDYFQTAKSTEPSDTTTFYELVKAARAITVATEPYWVRRCWLDETSVSSGIPLEKLMRHFRAAL